MLAPASITRNEDGTYKINDDTFEVVTAESFVDVEGGTIKLSRRAREGRDFPVRAFGNTFVIGAPLDAEPSMPVAVLKADCAVPTDAAVTLNGEPFTDADAVFHADDATGLQVAPSEG